MLRKSKSAELSERIAIHALQEDMLLLADGSLSIGYTVTDFADESLSGPGYEAWIKTLARTVGKLPVGTVLQKVDSYAASPFSLPPSGSCWQEEQQAYYQGRTVLRHQA